VNTGQYLSIRAYARHRKALGLAGGTPAAVSKAIQSGRIQRDLFGRIDPVQADADWAANTGAGADQVDEPRDAPLSVTRERARLLCAQAEKAELEVAKTRGLLLDAGDVQSVWSKYISNARARLLSLPASAAPRVAGETVSIAADVIRVLVFEALDELAAYDPDDYAGGDPPARKANNEGGATAPCEPSPDDQSAPLGADTLTPVGESAPGGITPPDDRDRTPGKDRPQPRRKRGGVDVKGHPPTGEARPQAHEAGSTPTAAGRVCRPSTAGDHP